MNTSGALILPIKADRPAYPPRSVVVYGTAATIMPAVDVTQFQRLWGLKHMRLMARARPTKHLYRNVLILSNERPLPSAERRLQVIHYDAAMCALRAFLAVPRPHRAEGAA